MLHMFVHKMGMIYIHAGHHMLNISCVFSLHFVLFCFLFSLCFWRCLSVYSWRHPLACSSGLTLSCWPHRGEVCFLQWTLWSPTLMSESVESPNSQYFALCWRFVTIWINCFSWALCQKTKESFWVDLIYLFIFNNKADVKNGFQYF